MQKIIEKLISILIIAMMLGATAMPAIAYGASEIEAGNTTEDNVKIDAQITSREKGENATLDINKGGLISASIKVLNSGYLKDAKITLNDANYSVDEDELNKQNEQSDVSLIKSINGNVIEINNINAGENAEIEIPIKFAKAETVDTDIIEKESSINFEGTYINEKGKAKKVKKDIKQNLKWEAQGAEAEIKQELTRYIKYDNKTMLSFDIEDGVKDNTIAAKNKKVEIIIPKINNSTPEKYLVTGDGIKYEEKDRKLIITKTNIETADKKIKWDSSDKYEVTYIYESQTDEKNIKQEVTSEIDTIDGNKLEGKADKEEFEISAEKGALVELNREGAEEVNKGYLITNVDREDKLKTNFETKYNVGIGYSEIIDEIKITENASTIEKENGEKVEGITVKTNKISVAKEDLVEKLGTDGKIVIKNNSGSIIATLNSESTEATLNGETKITIEISKPVKQGEIAITEEKEIVGDNNLSKEIIETATRIKESAVVSASKDSIEIENKTREYSIKLVNPTTKAKVEIEPQNLSTVVDNKNVIINVTLETKDITDRLYKDPEVRIKFPEQVEKLEITKGTVLYDNAVTAGDYKVEGKEIVIKLTEIQRDYSDTNVADGTVIRIVANIGLNNLATSSEEKIVAEVTNNANGEKIEAETTANIVAPSGFVTTNTIKIDDKEETAVEEAAKKIETSATAGVKNATVTGKVINNLGKEAKGTTILGRIPFKGNKTITGNDLGTTFDTQLAGAITTTLNNAKVYYSANGEESIDGAGWTENVISNAKSFKIVTSETLADKTMGEFSYNVSIPSEIGYENEASEDYGVYYANDADQGNKYNLVEAKTVGITTGKKPNLDVTMELYDENTGDKIENEGDVTEGENVILKVKAKNTGTTDFNNVTIKTEVPSGLLINGLTDAGEKIDDIYHVDLTKYSIKINDAVYDTEGSLVSKSNVTKVTNIKANETYEMDISLNVYDEVSRVLTQEEIEGGDVVIEVLNTIVSSEDLDNTINVENNYRLKEGTILLVNNSDISKNFKAGDEVNVSFTVKNPNNKDKKNIQVSMELPEGIKLKENNDEINQNKNIITIKNFDLSAYAQKDFTIPFNIEKISGSNSKIIINATYNESTKKLIIDLGTSITDEENGTVTVKQTTNINDSEITDRETIEYYTTIVNNTKTSKVITFDDNLADELEGQEHKLIIGNNESTISKGNYVSTSFTLPSNTTAKIVVTAKIRSIAKGESKTIENKPSVTSNDVEIDVNSISIKVSGTGASGEPTNGKDEIKNKIEGTVWYDINNNGIREENEEKLSGIRVKLYNANTSDMVKDGDKDLERTTDGNGKYSFENLENGKYIVIIEYDTSKYDVGNYKVDGATEAENSDFVKGKLDGKDVAATNNIEVNNSNTYNIDLALVSNNVFDLKLDKEVSKITVNNPKARNPNKVYEYNKNLAKVELASRNIESTTVIIEYKIKVTNVGKIAGYAKSIVDYIPDGLSFNADLNKDWYTKSGNAYNGSLANEKIGPGETKEITLILTKRMNAQNVGTFRNTAEIADEYNDQGYEDVNSKAGNKQDGENDMSSADAYILVSTGKEIMSITGISIGIIALIGFCVEMVRKHVLNKMI